jgi:Fur family ferric uptake transcriptional regulator
LVCRECGVTVEIAATAIEAWAKEVAAQHGFSAPEHLVDVFGVCPACQETSTGN